MTASIPQIGFDRLVRLEWADMAMRVRAGNAERDELEVLLTVAGLAKETRRKTGIVLNRLWLEPHPALHGLADRAVALRSKHPKTLPSIFCWGMAISAYPFFGQVAENIGRLSSLHGDCTTAEIHRRMRERYGERETIVRATNRVIQSQVDWETIRHGNDGKQVLRKPPIHLESNEAVAWLVEAAVRYAGKALPVATLMSMPVLFPFVGPGQLAYLLSSIPTLDVHDQGSGQQFVSVRETA